MRHLMTFFISALALLLLMSRGAANETAAVPEVSEPGSDLSVYVLTFGPGDDPWEKWGHNALRLVDPHARPPFDDLCYNWGQFPDFNSTFFVKFLQGRLLYSMGSYPTYLTVQPYLDRHRLVYMQKLNLTPKQKWALRNKLRREDTDQNRYYLYNYYTINCSTKVRDAVNEASGGALARVTVGKPTGTTYRFHTDRFDYGDLWLYVALQAVMGHPVDQPIDRWQEMFAPLKLHDGLNDATVQIDGKTEPLVLPLSASDVAAFDHFELPGIVEGPLQLSPEFPTGLLGASPRPRELQEPPNMAPWLLAAGLTFGLIFAVLGSFARRHWTARWGFVLLTTPWLLLMGLGGTIMWWGWLMTDHEVARHNENVMQVSVLSLLLLIMLPRLAFGKKRGVNLAMYLTFMMAAISVLGLLLKVMPWFRQVNWPIVALCLPVNVALAYAAWKMARAPAVAIKGPGGSGRKEKKSAARK